MITDFSLRGIIKGCINSKDISSPECKLLNRISEGQDLPEYPEIYPELRYFYQLPTENFERSIDRFQYFSLEEFLQDCLQKHGEYPDIIWVDDYSGQ